MVNLLVFIFGLIIGSFLNVCIYRMPRSESLVFPGSRCVSCKKPIQWYDNIPLISYVLLRGKCRHCKAKFSPRYFFVELITAASFLILFANFKFNDIFWIYSLLVSGLIVIAFIDLEFQLIPDSISLVGIFIGIILSAIFPGLQGAFTWQIGLLNSILGAIAGGGLIYLTGVLGKLAFKKDSMGGGDVKLMAMLGAFLGWKMAVLIFFLAPFFGAPIGIYVKFVKKEDIIPYGPYISLAGFVAMIWGHKILSLLLNS
ncbi:MAG: prepilin peptidase [Candidatus Omnitrophica bacterium CG_4_9_14_0_2_um_filter_42_8]|nr:MAG: prepilin peptidase [Candidatus Omnitrophica bacterium CG22_combo_CG10-13_8_21_14_all_43_16]PJC47604.1 MAG: prepilin peptidase [Candidatus Omnitrophica bacterium CG_4_9_14_0_2_um_filter_42_8]